MLNRSQRRRLNLVDRSETGFGHIRVKIQGQNRRRSPSRRSDLTIKNTRIRRLRMHRIVITRFRVRAASRFSFHDSEESPILQYGRRDRERQRVCPISSLLRAKPHQHLISPEVPVSRRPNRH